MSLGAKVAAGFLIALVTYGVVYQLYYYQTKSTSNYKYTVATVVDNCAINGTLGNSFEYTVAGKSFSFCKVDDDLRAMRKGDRILIRYYLKDPSAYDLISMNVPRGIQIPENGWNEIPKLSTDNH